MAAICSEGLTKIYEYHYKTAGLGGSIRNLFRRQTKAKVAVDSVSFGIESGEIVGFLGPNGAGKTTTLKMLCGILYPSAGSVTVLGHTPAQREADFLRQIALVMGQKNALWWDLPAIETLELRKEIYGLDGSAFRRTVDELSDMLQVDHLLHVQVRKLSLGERMKIELLTALVHRPTVLFLDEPTIGLDVISQQRIRDFLRRLNHEHHTTILLTSHYMADIAALCPRVLVIDHGRLHYDGPLDALIGRLAPQKLLRVIFEEEVSPMLLAAAVGDMMVDPPEDRRAISLAVPRDRVAEVAGRLLSLGQVADIGIEEIPIEEVIRKLFASSSGSSW